VWLLASARFRKDDKEKCSWSKPKDKGIYRNMLFYLHKYYTIGSVKELSEGAVFIPPVPPPSTHV
jgi:hypothetical protein